MVCGLLSTYLHENSLAKMIFIQFKFKGCDYVIALTHMRTPNDVKLAENCEDIDIILGGHDHVYEIKHVNDKYIIKSGTDFRQFSKITINFDKPSTNNSTPEVTIEEINVTSQIQEDQKLKEKLEKYTSRFIRFL